MKKRTNQEKLQMIDEACDLFREAAEMIRVAKQKLHLCGIETCDGFYEKPIREWETSGDNVQVYSGIKKLEEITATKGYFKNHWITEKPDKSRLYLNYKDLVFMQVSDPISTRNSFK